MDLIPIYKIYKNHQRFTSDLQSCKCADFVLRAASTYFSKSIYDLQENLEVSIEEFRDNQYTDSATN